MICKTGNGERSDGFKMKGFRGYVSLMCIFSFLFSFFLFTINSLALAEEPLPTKEKILSYLDLPFSRMAPFDLDGDGSLDSRDLDLFEEKIIGNRIAGASFDLTGNGSVDGFDLIILQALVGRSGKGIKYPGILDVSFDGKIDRNDYEFPTEPAPLLLSLMGDENEGLPEKSSAYLTPLPAVSLASILGKRVKAKRWELILEPGGSLFLKELTKDERKDLKKGASLRSIPREIQESILKAPVIYKLTGKKDGKVRDVSLISFDPLTLAVMRVEVKGGGAPVKGDVILSPAGVIVLGKKVYYTGTSLPGNVTSLTPPGQGRGGRTGTRGETLFSSALPFSLPSMIPEACAAEEGKALQSHVFMAKNRSLSSGVGALTRTHIFRSILEAGKGHSDIVELIEDILNEIREKKEKCLKADCGSLQKIYNVLARLEDGTAGSAEAFKGGAHFFQKRVASDFGLQQNILRNMSDEWSRVALFHGLRILAAAGGAAASGYTALSKGGKQVLSWAGKTLLWTGVTEGLSMVGGEGDAEKAVDVGKATEAAAKAEMKWKSLGSLKNISGKTLTKLRMATVIDGSLAISMAGIDTSLLLGIDYIKSKMGMMKGALGKVQAGLILDKMNSKLYRQMAKHLEGRITTYRAYRQKLSASLKKCLTSKKEGCSKALAEALARAKARLDEELKEVEVIGKKIEETLRKKRGLSNPFVDMRVRLGEIGPKLAGAREKYRLGIGNETKEELDRLEGKIDRLKKEVKSISREIKENEGKRRTLATKLDKLMEERRVKDNRAKANYSQSAARAWNEYNSCMKKIAALAPRGSTVPRKVKGRKTVAYISPSEILDPLINVLKESRDMLTGLTIIYVRIPGCGKDILSREGKDMSGSAPIPPLENPFSGEGLPAVSQSDSLSIGGTVYDSHQKIAPGAIVVMIAFYTEKGEKPWNHYYIAGDPKWITRADQNGRFRIENIPPPGEVHGMNYVVLQLYSFVDGEDAGMFQTGYEVGRSLYDIKIWPLPFMGKHHLWAISPPARGNRVTPPDSDHVSAIYLFPTSLLERRRGKKTGIVIRPLKKPFPSLSVWGFQFSYPLTNYHMITGRTPDAPVDPMGIGPLFLIDRDTITAKGMDLEEAPGTGVRSEPPFHPYTGKIPKIVEPPPMEVAPDK